MKSRPVVVVQRVCPHYRVPFFRCLGRALDLLVVYGDGDRSGSYCTASEVSGFGAKKLRRIQLNLTKLDPYLRVVWFPSLFFHLVKLRPSAVICGGVSDFLNALTVFVYSRFYSVPMIVWDGGRRVGKPMPLARRVAEPINRFLLTRAKACIAYSRMAAASFREVGVEGSRIFLAPNTIDVESMENDRDRLLGEGSRERVRRELGVGDEATLFLYVGGIEPRKRLEALLEYMRDRRADRNTHLLVVGDGPELARLRGIAAREQLSAITFAGRVVDGVGRLFVAADAFVLPGPGGLSINQAMAYGLPVVVWGGDGTEEDLICDGVDGFVVGSRAEMVERLDRLTEDTRGRDAMAQRVREKSKNFRLERMRQGFLEAIAAASSGREVPPLCRGRIEEVDQAW